jgi:chromosome segregation ATPase
MFFKFSGSKPNEAGAKPAEKIAPSEPVQPTSKPPVQAASKPVQVSNKKSEVGALKVEKTGDAGEAARALGTYHEELRNRCESAANSLNALRSTAEEVEDLFTEFGNIAKQLHDHKKELAEARAVATTDRGLIEELRGKLSNTQSSLMKIQSQYEEIAAERDNLLRTRMELGDAYQSGQIALKENESRIKVLEMELSSALNSVEDLSIRFDTTNRSLVEKDRELHELKEERKLLQANLDFEMAEKNRFSRLHDEVVSAMNSQRRALNSAGEELEKSRERIMHLEARHSEILGEKESLTANLETAKALRESDTKNFEVKLEAVNSRARLAEHLLDKARGEQRSSYVDQTAQTELQRQIRNLEGMIETMKQDLAEATRRNRELENSENVRKAKNEDLQLQIRSMQRSSEQSADKIKNFQELLEAVQARHAVQEEQYEEQMRQLSEQVERERSDRVYLEGALNTARRERNHMQSQLIKIKTGQQDPASMMILETESENFREEFMESPARNSNIVTELRPAKATDKGN